MLLNEGRDSFLEEVVNFNDARYIVIPVPIDITTTYLKGTKFGPRSVIEASRSLENYDSEVGYELKDKIFISSFKKSGLKSACASNITNSTSSPNANEAP